MSIYQYFTLPISNVPETLPENMWFATWSTARSAFVWSAMRPDPAPTPTYVCGATEEYAPTGATIIVQNGTKCIDPPPIAVPIDATESEFQAELRKQIIIKMDRTRSL
jgi:hypothetical protein